MAIIKTMTKNYIVFLVASHSRNFNHEVIFNRVTREWSCTCEDYFYRKRACKHTRECKALLNSLVFECSSTTPYKGVTLTNDEIQAQV